MSRIAALLAAPPVYAPEGLDGGAGRTTGSHDGGVHPVVMTRLFLLLAAAVAVVLLAARGAWLLLPLALLPLAGLAWLAARYAAHRRASWAVLALSVFSVGPAVLVLLATLR